MSHSEHDPDRSFATGLITGVFVGAGVALLLAPKAGAELRADLGGSWGAIREGFRRRYQELAERAGAELDHVQTRIDRTADAVESSATRLVQTAADEARQAWGERRQR